MPDVRGGIAYQGLDFWFFTGEETEYSCGSRLRHTKRARDIDEAREWFKKGLRPIKIYAALLADAEEEVGR